MSDAERALLEKRVSRTEPTVTLGGTLAGLAIWSGGLILGGLLVWGVSDLSYHMARVVAVILIPIDIICLYAVFTLIGSYFRSRREFRRFSDEERPKIRTGLADGRVAVKKVVATAVVKLQEFEGQGPGFVYDIGDGKLLFLKGQRFSAAEEDREWPNGDFEIVRTAVGDCWVGIFCRGQALVPVQFIPVDDCKDEVVWADEERLVDGELQAFARSLRDSGR